jgi:hypothetical protein
LQFADEVPPGLRHFQARAVLQRMEVAVASLARGMPGKCVDVGQRIAEPAKPIIVHEALDTHPGKGTALAKSLRVDLPHTLQVEILHRLSRARFDSSKAGAAGLKGRNFRAQDDNLWSMQEGGII